MNKLLKGGGNVQTRLIVDSISDGMSGCWINLSAYIHNDDKDSLFEELVKHMEEKGKHRLYKCEITIQSDEDGSLKFIKKLK